MGVFDNLLGKTQPSVATPPIKPKFNNAWIDPKLLGSSAFTQKVLQQTMQQTKLGRYSIAHSQGFTGVAKDFAYEPSRKLHVVAMGRIAEYLLKHGIDFRVPVRTEIDFVPIERVYRFRITTMDARPLTTCVGIPAEVVEDNAWDTIEFGGLIEQLVAGMMLSWRQFGSKNGG